jgi:hypothetical protein
MKLAGAMIQRAVLRRQAVAELYSEWSDPPTAADAVLAVHDEFVYDVQPDCWSTNAGMGCAAMTSKPHPGRPAAHWFEGIVREVEDELNDLLQWPVRIILSFEHGPNWSDAH